LKKLTKNLFMAASLLLSGGICTMAQAQSDTPASPKTAETQQQSRAQQLMGDVAPKLAELTDNVLFGDIWERPGLSKRDRSLVTVSALIALNRPDQLRSHIALARRNGVTETEIVEAITQLAFYSGWPNAISAVGVARRQPAASAAPFARQRNCDGRPGIDTARHASPYRIRPRPKRPGHRRPARRLPGPEHRRSPELHGRGARRGPVPGEPAGADQRWHSDL
jgi:4-carboxymuconolactone decarboxylase